MAGKIPRAALRSFVKQAQLQRKEKRGETSGEKMWWRVSNPGNSYASVEVVASSKEEAIEKALGDDGYPSWANTRQSIVAEPVRPYEEATVPTLNGRPSNPDGNWFLKNSDTNEIIYRFNAVNYQDAYTVLQQWEEAHPGDENIVYGPSTDRSQSGRPNDPNGRYAVVPRSDPALYGRSGRRPEYLFRFNMGNATYPAQGRYILQAWAARNNVVPADYMVVDTEQWDQPTDAASGGKIDIEPDVAQALPVSGAAANTQAVKLAPTSAPAPRTGPRVITFDAKPKAATKPKAQAKLDPKKSTTKSAAKSTTKTAAKNAALKPAAKKTVAKKSTKK